MLGPEYEKAMQAAMKLNDELGLTHADGSVIAWVEGDMIVLRVWLYSPERFDSNAIPESYMGYDVETARKPVFHAC